jgi:prolyl-tRNA synthetase
MKVAGKIVVVTGGAKGIGLHYSKALAAAGARVMIADIVDGKDAAAEIAAAHGADCVASFTFDVSDEASMVCYRKMYDTYQRIFNRCGLRNFPVEADPGVIGGSQSHEFMVPADTGENEVVFCDACGYAANIEKATSGVCKSNVVAADVRGREDQDPKSTVEKFATPGVVTIDALSRAPFNVPPDQQIKTHVYIVQRPPVLILVRGDDQLNEAKLAGALGTPTFRPAEAEEIFAALGAHPGSLGAVTQTFTPALSHRLGEGGLAIYADERLRGATGMTTGANADGFHLRNVSIDRDIQVTRWVDLRMVQAGEPCAKCGQPLKIRRAIEVGHVFILGTKYSEKLGATFLAEDGRRKPCIMGCYGIGVTRTLQAVIEQCNDKDGIIWPVSVAPYTVCITPLNVAAESPVMKLAQKLYADLAARGVEVILDDRDERPGVKFKDADLIGIPVRITVGKKALQQSNVELKLRTEPKSSAIPLASAVAKTIDVVNALKSRLNA